MKYELETIPVREALQEAKSCPLCHLQGKTEQHLIRYFLGNSVMQPHIRKKVNSSGFCGRHLTGLQQGGNRLGLGLMLHTHLLDFQQELGKKVSALTGPKTKGSKTAKQRTTTFSLWLRSRIDDCLVCRRLTETMRRYAFTVTYLWDKDNTFRELLLGTQGFCLSHLALTLDLAVENLGPRLEAWLADILPLQQNLVETLQQDLLLFTRSYDYRSDGVSERVKSSLRRTIEALM